MKHTAFSLAIFLLFLFAEAGQNELSGATAPNKMEQLTRMVAELRKEVYSLHARLDAFEESTSYDNTDIKILEELVAVRAYMHNKIFALQRLGQQGGEADKEAQARYYLAISKARLAHAKGDIQERLKEQEAAVEATEKWVNAVEKVYESGRVTLDPLLEAQAQRADAKLQLNRIRKRIAHEQAAHKE